MFGAVAFGMRGVGARPSVFRRVATLGAVLVGAALVVIQACTSETITGVTVTDVSVTPASTSIMVGETAEFEASVVDETGAELEAATVSWSATSDDGDIVEIDANGVATGLAPGEAEITATFQGSQGTATLTVVPVPDIGVDPSSVTLYGGVDGPAPEAVTVDVTNPGSGSLTGLSAEVSVPEGSPDGWLEAALADDVPPTELTLTADSTGFPAGAYEATVTLSSPDAPDGPANIPVTLSLTGFTLTAPEGGVRVAEADGTDSIGVVLDRAPDSDVVLEVRSGDEDEAVVSPERLTFTPDDWDTEQTITVTGVDDSELDGDQETPVTVSVDPEASDIAYHPAVDRSVTVTTVDDDEPGFLVTETDESTSVSESGTTDDIEVRLRAQPASDVVITVAASDPGEATVSPSSLRFTPTNWDVDQAVTVTGEDDSVVDGSVTSTVTFSVDEGSSDDDYHGLEDQTVTVTTTDDDGAAIRISESQGSTVVSEEGTTDAFTVRLDAQPSADVVLDVTSGDTGEVTVNPSTLTFTPDDWEEAQPVTLTGVDDDLIDGDVVTTVTVAVDVGASASEYESAADGTVEVTTTDDDGAGLDIDESGDGTAVSESGTSDSLTVALTAEPTSEVVVEVTSGDTGEATVDPGTLTFTPETWDEPQTVTVTGVDDDALDGNQETDVTLAVDADASDADFGSVAETVVVTTSDDDAPGFTVTSGGTVSVSEAGGTADVTVVLNTEPASDVVLTFAIDDASVATVDPEALTFTSANWDTEQTVTVTGVDDDVDDGDQTATLTISVDPAQSDDDFDDVADELVEVTAEDDDVAGFTLADTTDLTVSEGGGTDAFTAVLHAEPVDDVVLTVTSADEGEVTASPAELTFTSENWDAAQTVTLSGVDDLLVDGEQSTTVTVAVDAPASDDAFDGVAAQDVGVTNEDDELAGFTLSDTADLEVTEGGSTAEFTVTLDVEPVDPVVLSVESGDTGEVTASPTELTFTSDDWDTPQTVTLTGVDDELIDGDQETTITVSVAGGSDDAFSGLDPETATVTTTDDDGAGFTVTGADGATSVTAAEGGDGDVVEVVLTAQPLDSVVLNLSADDSEHATVTPTSVTFDGTNWDQVAVVEFAAVDDALVDGTRDSTVTVSVDPSSDAAFTALDPETLPATTTDNDTAAFTVTETDGSTVVDESGTTDSLAVVLDARPVDPVVLNVTSGDEGEVTVSPTSLTFEPEEWDTEQTVTLTGEDDDRDDGRQVTTVTVAVADGSDTDFTGLEEAVEVTTMDDDGAGITPSADILTIEEGSTDSFTVVLDTEPGSNVVLNVTRSSELSTAPEQLTYTPGNWDSLQTVTVTGEDDDAVDGDEDGSVVLTVDDAESDSTYHDQSATVEVTITEDDEAGFTVTGADGSGSVTAAEGGPSDNVEVVLTAQPVDTVVLDLSADDSEHATVTPMSVTFDSTNWDQVTVVEFAAVEDSIVDGTRDSTVTVSVDPTSDSSFAALPPETLPATTTDNDSAGFTVTESDDSTVVNEDGSTDEFTVVLDAQPESNVMFEIASADTGEATVDSATLTFEPAAWDTPKTVTVTGVEDSPLVDGNQTTPVTLSVADGSDGAFVGLADDTVQVTTEDTDSAGFTVTGADGSSSVTAAEGGDGDIVEVVLTAQPVDSVVLNLSADDSEHATVTPISVTFDSTNWDQVDSVEFAAIDDSIIDGTRDSTVTVSVDTSSDSAFAALDPEMLLATTTDNDTAGVAVDPETLNVTEGETGDFSVALTAEPFDNVTVAVRNPDPAEIDLESSDGSEGDTIFTFTPDDWNTDRTVTVTAIDDGESEEETPLTVSIEVTETVSDADSEFVDVSNEVEVTVTDPAEFEATRPTTSTTPLPDRRPDHRSPSEAPPEPPVAEVTLRPDD